MKSGNNKPAIMQNGKAFKLLPVTILLLAFTGTLTAQQAQSGCAYLGQYLAPFELPIKEWPAAIAGPAPGEVEQRLVGPEECRIVAEKVIHNSSGVPYRQVTVALSGTVFGYVPVNSVLLNPMRSEDGVEGGFGNQEFFLTDHIFIWQAAGVMGPFVPGVANYQYSEQTPASLEILIPVNPADWNGNMWVLAHGGGRHPPLVLHPREAGKFNRYSEASEGAGPLIDMGFAVVWTRREGATDLPSSLAVASTAVLDNGMVVGGPGKPGMAFNETVGLIRDYTVISRNYVEEQLGSRPKAIFFRGHSGGGAMGRSLQLVKGMNTDHDGELLFDGFYLDDSAGGRGAATFFWEAEVVDEMGTFRLHPSDNDALIFDEDQTRFMVPTIEVIHGAYAGNRTATVPRIFERVPAAYYEYKRENARINIEKGLGDLWKSYEIAGVSHSDASSEAINYPELARDMVDIGGVAIALEQALVDWVLNGKKPPATRVDAADVWELDPEAGPAIQLPETACPRGIYRGFMNRPDGTAVGATPALFIPYLTESRPQINQNQERPPGFQEEWLEPLDRYGYLVDMTGTGHRMTRPTIKQVWHLRYRQGLKTGVLRPYEEFTRDAYVNCVTGVVADLRADGLLTPEAEKWYVEKAYTDDIGVD